LRRGSRHNREQGIVIALVAAFMLVVIGAMMALSIDVVTFYTARSEAQLAADAAALAGARVLANSGITSDPGGAVATADSLAQNVARRVAEQNQVAGEYLTVANVPLPVIAGTDLNPTITVHVQIPDVPTFFARMLGIKSVKVAASATAEAYNPSPPAGALVRTGPPVAPLCVKPWLLPNLDPTQTTTGTAIFDRITGRITNPSLIGQEWPSTTPPNPNPYGLYAKCGDCSTGITVPPLPGAYYPGKIDAADFPAPTQALPTCSAGFNSYQLVVAGCVQQPISCGATATINIDTNFYGTTRDLDTVAAAGCLIHYNVPGGVVGDSDSIDTAAALPPIQFLAGNENPVASAVGKDVVVSDSLVTIPVVDVYPGMPTPPSVGSPGVTVIGFVQVFLNPSATAPFPYTNPPPPPIIPNQIPATIINMAGCGNSATGTPILGNGASPVAVRLISP
jgi:hypothetical protein